MTIPLEKCDYFLIREMYFGILFLKPHRVRKWSRIIPMSKTWGEFLVFDKRREVSFGLN